MRLALAMTAALLAACGPRAPATFVQLDAVPPALSGRLPVEARGLPLLADPNGCLYFIEMRAIRPAIDPATEVQVCVAR
ncbi:MAG: hypothetical protein ACU0BS_14300 [Hasllibacter sp.]